MARRSTSPAESTRSHLSAHGSSGPVPQHDGQGDHPHLGNDDTRNQIRSCPFDDGRSNCRYAELLFTSFGKYFLSLFSSFSTILADTLLPIQVGPKKRDFKVKDFKEKYEFDPAELVSSICQIYCNLGSVDAFCIAVSQDGRSYSPELFTLAESVLSESVIVQFFRF